MGDYVSVSPEEPNEPFYIAHVTSMWEESGERLLHGSWLNRGGETVLGEASDSHELFLVDSCGDSPISAVTGKVSVRMRTSPSNWHMLGDKILLYIHDTIHCS